MNHQMHMQTTMSKTQNINNMRKIDKLSYKIFTYLKKIKKPISIDIILSNFNMSYRQLKNDIMMPIEYDLIWTKVGMSRGKRRRWFIELVKIGGKN